MVNSKSARTCDGRFNDPGCANNSRHLPRYESGAFQVGLPQITRGECTSLGWELLPDGTYRLRIDRRAACVRAIERDETNVLYSEERRGICPPTLPNVGEVYQCLDRFGTALIKTGVAGSYEIGFSPRCQGSFQSVKDVINCPEDFFSQVTLNWSDWDTITWGGQGSCAGSVLGNLCQNKWTIVEEYYLPGARPRRDNVRPQGTCTGMEDNVSVVEWADPSFCGGFNPCGKVVIYECDHGCFIGTEGDVVLSTEGDVPLVWCVVKNESGFVLTEGLILQEYVGPGGAFSHELLYPIVQYSTRGNITKGENIPEWSVTYSGPSGEVVQND